MEYKAGQRLVRNTKTGAVYWFNEHLVKDKDFKDLVFLTPAEEAHYLGVPMDKNTKKVIQKGK